MSFTKRLQSLAGHDTVCQGDQELPTCSYTIAEMGTFTGSIDGSPALTKTETGEGELNMVTDKIPEGVVLTFNIIDDGNFSYIAASIPSSPRYYSITPTMA